MRALEPGTKIGRMTITRGGLCEVEARICYRAFVVLQLFLIAPKS
jgi:hypothetical protein